MQEYGLITFTTKMYQRQFSPVDSLLPFALTDCPVSYSAAQTQSEIHGRLLLQNKAATITCVATHSASAIHKQKKQKGIVFSSCLVLKEARTRHE